MMESSEEVSHVRTWRFLNLDFRDSSASDDERVVAITVFVESARS